MQLTIASLGARGEGVAELGGARVFVPLALPGEVVEADIAGERATVRDILAPSPHRAVPFCKHFGRCGGCTLQHLDGPAYGEFKRSLIETPLRRAGFDTPIENLVIAHGQGRRRTTFHARREGGGFMRMRSHQVHDLDRCPILVPALQARAPAITRAVFAAIGEADVAFTATATGLDLAIRAERKGLRPERLGPLLGQFSLPRIAVNGEVLLQTAPPTVRMGKADVPLPVGSFLQATEAAEIALAELCRSALGSARRVADLFCGVGPFALRLAESTPVYAADSDRDAVAALTKAVRSTPGLKPVTAVSRDLFREPLTAVELKPFDVVLFDPPRAGAEAQARELARSTVATVVAVSCDPRTFARDAAILAGGGYRLEQVVPVDQFAYSAHLETVSVFRR